MARVSVKTVGAMDPGILRQDLNMRVAGGGVWTLSRNSPADEISQDTGTNALFSIGGDSETGVGQQITTDGPFYLLDFSFWLIRVNKPSGGLVAKIYANNSGLPGELLHVSDTLLKAEAIGTSAAPYRFSFTNTYLAGGTVYFLTIEKAPDYYGTSNDTIQTAGVYSSAYPGGDIISRGATSWSYSSGFAHRFTVRSLTGMTLSWSQDAFIKIPGVPDARNRIPPGSTSFLPGDSLYVEINRDDGDEADLVVSKELPSAVPLSSDAFIFAYSDDEGVIIGDRILKAN